MKKFLQNSFLEDPRKDAWITFKDDPYTYVRLEDCLYDQESGIDFLTTCVGMSEKEALHYLKLLPIEHEETNEY